MFKLTQQQACSDKYYDNLAHNNNLIYSPKKGEGGLIFWMIQYYCPLFVLNLLSNIDTTSPILDNHPQLGEPVVIKEPDCQGDKEYIFNCHFDPEVRTHKDKLQLVYVRSIPGPRLDNNQSQMIICMCCGILTSILR